MKRDPYKWCNGLAETAGILGVPVIIIKRAKKHPAFQACFRQNGRSSPDLIRPLLEQFKGELEAEDNVDNREYWQKRKAKADALTAEIELDELKKKYLDKDEVITFLKQIATAQRALLKAKLVNELPSKLLGLNTTESSVVLDKALDEVLRIFQNGLDDWK